MVSKLFNDLERPAYSILPPGLSQHRAPYFTDAEPEIARQLFEEGLKEINVKAKDLPPFMITCCDQEIHHSIAMVVAKQWKDVLGVDTKIEAFKWERFMEKCYQQHDFQLMGVTWYSWVYDPSYNLEHLKTLSHEMNTCQWSDPKYSAYLEKAQECIDQTMRLELLHQAESIVMQELPIIPLFYYTFKYMKKDYLDNIYLSHLGQIDFKWASINPNKLS
jgi:oligopeptide transport system substrate-binding protein